MRSEFKRGLKMPTAKVAVTDYFHHQVRRMGSEKGSRENGSIWDARERGEGQEAMECNDARMTRCIFGRC